MPAPAHPLTSPRLVPPTYRREYEQRYDPQAKQLIVGPELPHSQHAAKLRRLVVELAPPRFGAPDPTQPTPQAMNSEQHEAVRRVLTAQDYTLVLGMPGAGKTTTILSMVRALVAAGKSVLLTSYTNRWVGVPDGARATVGQQGRGAAGVPATVAAALLSPRPPCTLHPTLTLQRCGQHPHEACPRGGRPRVPAPGPPLGRTPRGAPLAARRRAVSTQDHRRVGAPGGQRAGGERGRRRVGRRRLCARAGWLVLRGSRRNRPPGHAASQPLSLPHPPPPALCQLSLAPPASA